MSELTAGREALTAVKSLPPEDAAERLGAALEKVLGLAEDWHGEYAGRDFHSNQDFAYTDGRDDAAMEIEQVIAALTDVPLPLPVGS